MNVFDLLLIAVALNALLTYWLQGKLFQEWQAWLENEPLWWLGSYNATACTLLRCGLCLAPWSALFLVLLWLAGPESWPGAIVRVAVYALTIARTANFLHDFWRRYVQPHQPAGNQSAAADPGSTKSLG